MRVYVKNVSETIELRHSLHRHFAGVLTVLGRPIEFLFNGDPVSPKLATHHKIVSRVDMESFLSSPKCKRNALCIAVINLLFLK